MASYEPINLTASATLNPFHGGTVVTLNAAAGLTVTLPAATGTGRMYRIVIGTTVTSNNYVVQVADATDVFIGNVVLGQDAADTAVLFECAADSDTITMNGTTKGGLKGDIITLVDVASNTWHLSMIGAATSTEATPLSAAVS
jgi:hypothetical protein